MTKVAPTSATSAGALPDNELSWVPEGEITVGTVGEPHARLLAAVQGGRSIRVDLKGCTYLDACALQLLVAAQKAARSAGLSFRCEKASDEVRQDGRELGLEFILDSGETEGQEGEITHG